MVSQNWPGRCLQPGQVRSENAWRLALSTHRGVLLQNVLPFGIRSAPCYFQQLMDEITCDLSGVVVYLDDILWSGATAEAHLQNLRRLLEKASWQDYDAGLRNAPSPSHKWFTWGTCCPTKEFTEVKVNALNEMPAPHYVSTQLYFSGLTAIPSYQETAPDLDGGGPGVVGGPMCRYKIFRLIDEVTGISTYH